MAVESVKEKPKLHMGHTVTAWGPQGQAIEFEPACHVCITFLHLSNSPINLLPLGPCNFGKY